MVKALVKGRDQLVLRLHLRAHRAPDGGQLDRRLHRLGQAGHLPSARGTIRQRAGSTQRADRSYRWYAYYEAEHAAVRRYDTGVVKVRTSRV
jgi:hypothetical protein